MTWPTWRPPPRSSSLLVLVQAGQHLAQPVDRRPAAQLVDGVALAPGDGERRAHRPASSPG